MTRPRLLFLSHRIPYPPNKGEKLRAYHLLRGLAAQYDIVLAAAIDDEEDWRHRDALAPFCVETLYADIRGRTKQRAGIEALATGGSITERYFRDPAHLSALRALERKKPSDIAFVYSSGALPMLDALDTPPGTVITDLVDVDSAKWTSLSEQSRGAMRSLYRREARLVADLERQLHGRSDATLLVSEQEAALARTVLGDDPRISALPNGVDHGYWSGGHAQPSPYERADGVRAIFTGVMDYPPNIDAVRWFASEVMPRARARGIPLQFVIAGSSPTREVLALGEREDIRVTGRVADMRPWLCHSDIAVAPLRVARGIQNKVLEAMAAALPVVATPAALEGIYAPRGNAVLEATTGAEFAETLAQLATDPARRKAIGSAGEQVVATRYGWASRQATLHDLISRVHAGKTMRTTAA